MKLNFNYDGRDAALRRPVGAAHSGGASVLASRCRLDSQSQTRLVSSLAPPRERGIALVVTMIFVTVIAFLAIAFLTLSYRERGSVSSTASQTDARLAAETALQRATAELLAPVIAFSNSFNYDLLVSTNYINPLGFSPGVFSPTNVNYDDAALKGWQLQNLANLLYDPRPPVFVVTNAQTGGSDFRFYLDLNRSGRFDTNGFLPVINPKGGYYDTNGNEIATIQPGNTASNLFVGDPEWIGILERPELPHSGTNKFIARYAYIAVPAGKTLDINYIHNDAKRLDSTMLGMEGFLRNQGVGSWENNLAAFLVDLNTNAWLNQGPLFAYNTSLNSASTGVAFEDALSLLRYRYNNSYDTLNAMPAVAANPGIDLYANGPLMTGSTLTGNNNDTGTGFSGSDNTSHFFNTQDLFDTAKASPQFYGRLTNAAAQLDSYDRYTFYRLLSQLGTDTAPETGKLNVNYCNVDNNGNIVPGMETTFTAWQPLQFFTNAAALMFSQLNLTDAYGGTITVTNIPLYPNNYYTPAVHRILQLAANIYDASTNSLYPTIFRPYFSSAGTNIFISGYELVNGPNDTVTDINKFMTPPLDLSSNATRTAIGTGPTPMNIYGAPWVIGAKKGLPNFNSVAMQTVFQVTRKLHIYRKRPDSPYSEYSMKQMNIIGISNVIGVSAWNSYLTNYPRKVYIRADGILDMTLTNELSSTPLLSKSIFLGPGTTNIPAGQWQGWGSLPIRPEPASFQVPLFTNYVFLPDSVYIQGNSPSLLPIPTNGNVSWAIIPGGNQITNFPQPHWGLIITNRIRCYIMDNGRVIDYVQMNGLNGYFDMMALTPNGIRTPDNAPLGVTGLWSTPRNTGYGMAMPMGVYSQIMISLGLASAGANWNDYGIGQDSGLQKQNDIDAFLAFMKLSSTTVNTNLDMQVPFTPTAKGYLPLVWEVNDPLVHYLPDDLKNPAKPGTLQPQNPPNLATNLTALTSRYSPWGGASPDNGDPNAWTMEVKDPSVTNSDAWDFPTNKFPNVGWLGRVHRGTPWQTVYLKANDINSINSTTWTNWSGNTVTWNQPNNYFYDANLSRPVNDRMLFDVFTAAVSPNATRGQLPINQTGLAAWSAVLSGVIALSNNVSDAALLSSLPAFTPVVINPAGVDGTNSAMQRIVNGINQTRAGANFNGSFKQLGDILAVPELTVGQPVFDTANNYWTNASPFLNLGNPNAGDSTHGNLTIQQWKGLNDAVYERLPQQILSLLRLGDQPRFVIYAYGQALKPANGSIVQSGPAPGICTNYQITGETAIRAVVRVDGAGAKDAKPYHPHVVLEQFNYLPPD